MTPPYSVAAKRTNKSEFEIAIEWQGKVVATAKGKSKKEAQQNCAYEACKVLGIIN